MPPRRRTRLRSHPRRRPPPPKPRRPIRRRLARALRTLPHQMLPPMPPPRHRLRRLLPKLRPLPEPAAAEPAAPAAAAEAAPQAAAPAAPAVAEAVPQAATRVAQAAPAAPVAPVAQVAQAAPAAPAVASLMPSFASPVSGTVATDYGVRTAGKVNHGIDFDAKPGSAVTAAAPGQVVFVGDLAGYGKVVAIKHSNDWATVYAHTAGIKVTKGQTVAKGQSIAEVACDAARVRRVIDEPIDLTRKPRRAVDLARARVAGLSCSGVAIARRVAAEAIATFRCALARGDAHARQAFAARRRSRRCPRRCRRVPPSPSRTPRPRPRARLPGDVSRVASPTKRAKERVGSRARVYNAAQPGESCVSMSARQHSC